MLEAYLRQRQQQRGMLLMTHIVAGHPDFDTSMRLVESMVAADVDLILDTTCNVTVNGVSNGAGGVADNVCDPTGGFQYTQTATENFGKINLKRGRRVIEFVFKYYF